MASENSYRGSVSAGDRGSDFNATSALVRNMLERVHTMTLCKVVGVEPGALGPAGYVDLQPLVNQLDGNGNAIAFPVVYRCPYVRLQAGANAISMDPEVGDIGVALFADRDISAVTATRGQANPGSRRRFDLADAIYLPAWSGVTPTQYVRFAAAGITIKSPALVRLEAPTVEIAASSVSISASGAVAISSASLTHNGVNIGATHRHPGVTVGPSNTGTPT